MFAHLTLRKEANRHLLAVKPFLPDLGGEMYILNEVYGKCWIYSYRVAAVYREVIIMIISQTDYQFDTNCLFIHRLRENSTIWSRRAWNMASSISTIDSRSFSDSWQTNRRMGSHNFSHRKFQWKTFGFTLKFVLLCIVLIVWFFCVNYSFFTARKYSELCCAYITDVAKWSFPAGRNWYRLHER